MLQSDASSPYELSPFEEVTMGLGMRVLSSADALPFDAKISRTRDSAQLPFGARVKSGFIDKPLAPRVELFNIFKQDDSDCVSRDEASLERRARQPGWTFR